MAEANFGDNLPPFEEVVSPAVFVSEADELAKVMEKSLNTFQEEEERRQHPVKQVVSHFETMFEMGIHSDLLVIVGQEKIKAHKCVLAARSAFFKSTMSYNDTIEEHKNKITITDFDLDVVKEMLRFLYSGSCRQLEELSVELVMISDIYGLDDLKDLAEGVLISDLNDDNAQKYIEIAQKFNVVRLRGAFSRNIRK